ncbi:MAG: D-alanine--D-alanine ligase [Planctomycetes bacterium]|nr:D-alanine--D-alanine ligase [Planctomycetota bacterium]
MLRIALLLGGTSTEREVSLNSGNAVHAALERIGHTVIPVDVCDSELRELDNVKPDFVFICLHGGEGEDGTIQSKLEARKLAYSGSGPIASRLAMDKELAKSEFIAQRVPTPPSEVAEQFDARYRVRRMARRIGLPLAIKPTNQGSSIGVSIVHDIERADSALDRAFMLSSRVLIEKAIVGRELTVGVLGERALPVCEVVADASFFDFDAKYASDSKTRYVVNPELPGPTAKMAQHYAKRAHHALRCHGYSRVDMMLDKDGELWVLEVNTLPGMTDHSLLPKMAAAEGMSFDELVQEMIDVSMERRRKPISDRITRAVAA